MTRVWYNLFSYFLGQFERGMNIILVGFMGSGKSTVAVSLAEVLGFQYIDADTLISKISGMGIPQIFQIYGEKYFRQQEKKIISDLLTETDHCILSTGGGMPCYNNLIIQLNSFGVTVYLKCSTDVLVQRLKNGREDRPLIKGLDDSALHHFVSEKLAERSIYYEQAQFVVDADKEVQEIIQEIGNRLNINTTL